MSIKGNTETRESLVGNIHLLKKIPGYSAYEIAVKHGFKGTEEEWLVSISAYGIAVKLGFEGTVEEWIASLKGEKGDIGNVEFHGGIDALGERIKNVADPVEDGDAVNKKRFDEVVAESNEYIDKYLVKKGSQLDANNMTVKNVADPTNDYDAVNKKYADDTFTKHTVESIDTLDFLDAVYADEFSSVGNFLVNNAYNSISKYGKCICGCIRATALSQGFRQDAHLFTVKEAYRPVADVFIPVYTKDSGAEIFLMLRIDASNGECRVYACLDEGDIYGTYPLGFTYICK